ncbi:3-oxoacyl-ACP synthase [Cupriavidus gilardii]|uniref:beta-ketoacyl synthase chain length factor n=1 Tax=Cupriavidus gilardii TaxID=82541 RepID=UPI001EE58944|nr:beta-ketoacyl synthase chain length factor [Cupriavidus gilardii]MCG5258958.1 beta-ketoacyl synthase chain length factor [Cupriavidus gilardii]MDF9429121.1 3-oxoacyl-ACP synthase [Cupriavidus gilardii]
MTAPVFVEGIGLLGPGLTDWQQAAAILRGQAPYSPAATALPAPEGLPSAERRRTGPAVKLALAVGRQAIAASGRDAAALATVFSASGADGHNYHAICESLAGDDPLISPTRFHNSVHNAPAGYWSIATGAMASSNAMCAHDGSFAAGLLDAYSQVLATGAPCVLIAYDTDYPEPLRSARPIPDVFGLALVLTAEPGPATLASLRPSLMIDGDAAAPMADAALEALRATIPAARALPLLQVLARGDDATAVLDYLDPLRLRVEVAPWR